MSTTALLIYYGGFGFVICLAWAAFIGNEVNREMSAVRRRRYDRSARGLSIVGVIHPGLPLCGLDIARQLARLEEPTSARARTTLQAATWGTTISFVIASATTIVSVSR